MMYNQYVKPEGWNPADLRRRYFRATSLNISLPGWLLNIAPSSPASGLPVPDLERRQVPDNVVGVECRTGEGADSAGCLSGLGLATQRRVVKVRPEHAHCGLERFRADRGLPPAHHLRVEPGGLHRIRSRRTLSSHQQIAIAFAHGAVRRNLETAVERSLDDVGIDTDPLRLCQDARRLGAILRLLDELSGAKCGADQCGHNIRIFLRPVLPDGQHLFHRADQNVGDEMQDMADAEVDRDGIPGRADAERVDVTAGE